MIDTAYVQRMARYNRWQNQNLYGVADTLPDDERRRERGSFFGSIHKTLSHLLWADRVWMSRFGEGQKARGRHSAIGFALSRLGAAQTRARGLRRNHHRLGRQARCVVACERPDLLFVRRPARVHQAEVARGDAPVQPPDPSPRPDPLHVDAGGRTAARHRLAAAGGVTRCPIRAHSNRKSCPPSRGAADEAALEAVRIAALGKSGSVSALLRRSAR